MTTPQWLMLLALGCLGTAAILVRPHLRADPGLRRAFVGLALSGAGGLAISFSPPGRAVYPLALLMLAGIGLLISGLPSRPKNREFPKP